MDSEVDLINHYPNKQYLNEEEIIFRYGLEQKVMDTIASGNTEEMSSYLYGAVDMKEYPYNPIVRRLPQDPLRDRKNGLVIRNTLYRIAARKGGLPPIYQHLISEKYALKIENASSVDYLNHVLVHEMGDEYCQAVQLFSTLSYSVIIKQIVSYISNHLTETIKLSEVADGFHINASHLSRKFKQETGFTFIDYINQQKIEYAKLLFHEGNSSIIDVANISGFTSSSYFSKVFKKCTGISPKFYIEKESSVTSGNSSP